MNVTANGIEVETLVRWRTGKEVQTRRGPRILRKAKPTEEFWLAWRASKQALQAAGVSVGEKMGAPGEWECCWWQELPREEMEKREKSFTDSRAMDADIVVPHNEGMDYMPFQRGGIAYAKAHVNTLIGDEPGLGKTIQAIGLVNLMPEISRVLIITKAGLKKNWWRECTKWLVRPLSVGIADGQCFPTTDVVIINYDICRKWQKRLEFYWDLVVMDEVHYCKSSKSLRAKSVFGYKPNRNESANGMLPTSGIPAKRKLLLTGTPFENRPGELYPLLRYLLGDQCPSRSAYEKRYCGGYMTAFGWAKEGPNADISGLNKWLRESVLIRRLKKDVLTDLPPKTRIVVELEGDKQAVTNERAVVEKYQREMQQAEAQYELLRTIDSDMEYALEIKKLRAKFYTPFNEIARVRHETALSKVPQVIEAIKEDIDERQSPKILCFAHHRDVLMQLGAAFPRSVVVHGELSLKERDRLVQQFQNDAECGPFFGSIRATGEGLTLTAASLVGFVEEDWVPGKLSQCEDRAHRIGQKDNVLVKHWVLKDSHDAKMVATLVRKQEVLDKALDDEKKELTEEPVISTEHKSLATRKQLRIEASVLTPAQASNVLTCLISLRDNTEVEQVDGEVRDALASKASLSPMAAALGRKVVLRYRQHCVPTLVAACGGWQGEEKTVFGR